MLNKEEYKIINEIQDSKIKFKDISISQTRNQIHPDVKILKSEESIINAARDEILQSLNKNSNSNSVNNSIADNEENEEEDSKENNDSNNDYDAYNINNNKNTFLKAERTNNIII